jgi:hypothetical protein
MSEAPSPLALGIPRDPTGELRAIAPEQFAAALIEAAGIDLGAARALGCSPERVREARQQNPALEKAAQEGRRYLRDEAHGQMARAVQRGQMNAIALFLRLDAGASGAAELMDGSAFDDLPDNQR